MTDKELLKKYHLMFIEFNKIKKSKLKELNDMKDLQIIELEISIRMGYKIEEEVIRSKLESTLDIIDLFNNLKLGIE